MAYKFQMGPAVLSGTLVQEGTIEGQGVSSIGNLSASAQLLVGGATTLGGTVKLEGVADTAINLSEDSVFFRDGTDKGMKRDTFADLATAQAGVGLAASSGVFALDLNELGAATISLANDSFAIIDADDSNSSKKESISDFMTAMAGATAGGIGLSPNKELIMDINDLGAGTVSVANDSIAILDADDSSTKKESIADLFSAAAGPGIDSIDGSIELNLNSVDAAVVDVAADSIAIIDAGDSNLTKKESIADLATGMAGTGLAASSGAFSLDLNELGAAAVDVANDSIAIVDANDSNASKKESIVDLATAMVAGNNGLAASNGVFSVNVSGAVRLAADAVAISGSIAGMGLSFDGGADSIEKLELDITEFSDAAVQTGDKFLFIDVNDSNKQRLETIDDIATLFAGNGLSAASAVMALDLNELSAAVVDVSADSIAIVDATDNSTKKESIADLVAGMAGTGLTASGGQLSLSATGGVNGVGDADATLVEGTNYGNAQLTDNRTWTLPASAGLTAGDIVRVKAPADVNGRKIIVARAGSQTIDGSYTSVELESNNAALTLMYAAADTWILI